MLAKLQAISNNPDALAGLAMAEISSKLAHTPDELRQTLENISPDIGIVIITAGLAAKCADIIEKFRIKNHLPLITIIPDPHHHYTESNFENVDRSASI